MLSQGIVCEGLASGTIAASYASADRGCNGIYLEGKVKATGLPGNLIYRAWMAILQGSRISSEAEQLRRYDDVGSAAIRQACGARANGVIILVAHLYVKMIGCKKKPKGRYVALDIIRSL